MITVVFQGVPKFASGLTYVDSIKTFCGVCVKNKKTQGVLNICGKHLTTSKFGVTVEQQLSRYYICVT